MVTLRASNAQTILQVGFGIASIASIGLITRISGDGRPEAICRVVVRNIGSDADTFTVRFYDWSAGAPGVFLEELGPQLLEVNQQGTFDTSTYRLLELVPTYGAWALPSGRNPADPATAFAQTSETATTTTISITPARPAPGDPITVSGRLTRNDTGQGVSGQTIQLSHAPEGTTNYVSDGPALTDANGDYSKALSAPAAGRWTYDATFLGNVVLGLMESSGRTGYAVPSQAPFLAILVPVLVGAAILYAANRGR